MSAEMLEHIYNLHDERLQQLSFTRWFACGLMENASELG